jgi:hypothetical protein
MLLGQNLEDALDAIPGMLSDRLDNPKFLGPADAITGIPPDWRHNSDDMNEVRCELTPGAGMSGPAALPVWRVTGTSFRARSKIVR